MESQFIRFIKIGIIDQALPSDGGSWLLEVASHDDAQILLQLFLDPPEPPGCDRGVSEGLTSITHRKERMNRTVIKSSLGVMDGTRANYDEQAVVLAPHDSFGLPTGGHHGIFGGSTERKFLNEDLRRNEWLQCCSGGRRTRVKPVPLGIPSRAARQRGEEVGCHIPPMRMSSTALVTPFLKKSVELTLGIDDIINK